MIRLVGAAFTPAGASSTMILAATLGGNCDSLFDSLLGTTVQAIYHCPTCGKQTERYPTYTCGTGTTQIRGWRWLNNDLVNSLASIMGAGVAVAFSFL